MGHRTLFAVLFLFTALGGNSLANGQEQQNRVWKLNDQQPGMVNVLRNDQEVTTLHYKEFQRPILFPIRNGRDENVTRSWPVVEGVAGEATDHPHHKSLWFGHGDVNGASFWDESAKIENQDITLDQAIPAITLKNHWLVDGKKIAADTTTISFGQASQLPDWWIDYRVVVDADQEDLVFGDTKEGTFAIRTHPNLRLNNDEKRGVTTAAGHALNQAGDQDKELWGKRSPWVLYWGPIGKDATSLVMMDHPTNLRHPTTWHAREYGLVAANPFGLSFFEKAGKGAGDFTLKKGEQLVMHYRVLIADEQLTAEQVEKEYKEFAK